MEKTYKHVSFDIELAKKIQSGEVEGRIVTNHDKVVTLVDAAFGFNEEYWIPIIWHWSTEHNQLVLYNSKGECRNSHRDCYLHIELPEEASQTFHTEFPKGHAVLHGNTIICVKEETSKKEFKPFDKVLVRDCEREHPRWTPAIFQETDDSPAPYMASGLWWRECIPYEGNEHLAGTTNKPMEE